MREDRDINVELKRSSFLVIIYSDVDNEFENVGL